MLLYEETASAAAFSSHSSLILSSKTRHFLVKPTSLKRKNWNHCSMWTHVKRFINFQNHWELMACPMQNCSMIVLPPKTSLSSELVNFRTRKTGNISSQRYTILSIIYLEECLKIKNVRKKGSILFQDHNITCL